jgi:hypothetical protein
MKFGKMFGDKSLNLNLKYAFIPLILVILLTSCNLPRPTVTPMPHSIQHMTEIAAILNPEGLTPQATNENTTVVATPTFLPTSEIFQPLEGYLFYQTQRGDTLFGVAKRFEVIPDQIFSQIPLSTSGLLPVDLTLQIPDTLEDILPYQQQVLPDSEVVYGPSVGDFNSFEYIQSAGGFLSIYTEIVKSEVLTGSEIVELVAIETSTNPRLLLAWIEFRSNWVFDHPADANKNPYPLGFFAGQDTGLYNELMITAKLLAQGFYGWRDGSFTHLNFFRGDEPGRIAPVLNAGSVALMHLFASLYDQPTWEALMYGNDSFLAYYQAMFGDFWARETAIDPSLWLSLETPGLSIPFLPGEAWALTGGPHITWQTGTPWGALDFAPITGEPACAVSFRWATAAAPGLVVRSDRSVVAIDLDGDGDEGTGWVLIYQHMAERDRVTAGTWLSQDAYVGHPSCEGGQASGTHLHFTRKLNGEWLGVGEPFPLILSGWQAYPGERRYEGYLQNGEQIVTARPNGTFGSTIIRDN